MKSNQRFIERAKRNAVRPFDGPKLDYIQNNSGIKWFREITVFDNGFSTPNHLRVPDLSAQTKTNWVILEHDSTKLHGELNFPNEKTMKRNMDYMRTGRPFCIINQELAKLLGLDQAKLAAYLYYHTSMLEKTNQAIKKEDNL